MSVSSVQSGIHRRLNSVQSDARHSRSLSLHRRRLHNPNDAYTYALRVAYLSYLLQPRARRAQTVPRTHVRRSSSSLQDLIADFRLGRDSKSTRLPHGFVSELESRLTGVLVGKEKRKEYQDPLVVRTFAVFLNALKEETFKKRMEKDRRVEDLVLIFFSNATKELSRGKAPNDDSWSLMVDRHVALFVRLISLILKDHDWAKEKPELTSKLAVLESKLLAHDQDLAADGSQATSETLAPLSYDVKDMPMVQTVARIFGISTFQAQDDINRNKSTWTTQAALQDLKNYQAHLTLNTGRTLSRDDFLDDESYESWKKGEGPELSQMMLTIMQSNPDLAKSTPGGSLPQFQDPSRSHRASYMPDTPVDLSSLSLGEGGDQGDNIYTFIPPDPRSYYRAVLARALAYDLQDKNTGDATPEALSTMLLSKQSTELLSELCQRWRIPASSRVVLFLDVVREKFMDQEINVNTVDSAFTYIKETPVPEGKKRSSVVMSTVTYDRTRWLLPDVLLMKEALSSLHDALLRELYDVMMHCYDPKPHPIGQVMYVLDHHIRLDPYYEENTDVYDQFISSVHDGLTAKAKEAYQQLLEQHIPPQQDEWELFHVTQLGEAIMKLGQKIKKRYRNNPEIMG